MQGNGYSGRKVSLYRGINAYQAANAPLTALTTGDMLGRIKAAGNAGESAAARADIDSLIAAIMASGAQGYSAYKDLPEFQSLTGKLTGGVSPLGLRTAVNAIRRANAAGDAIAAEAIKFALPAVTPHGEFAPSRSNANFVLGSHTGLVALDYDKFADNLSPSDVRKALFQHSAVKAAWVTSQGRGVAALVAVNPLPNNPMEHEHAYYAARDMVAAQVARWGLVVDGNQKNLDRVRFLSADAGLLERADDEVDPVKWAMPQGDAPPPQWAGLPQDADWVAIGREAIDRLRPGKFVAATDGQPIRRWGAHGSLVQYADTGAIFCHETQRSFNVLEFIQHERGVDKDGALEWLRGEGLLAQRRATRRQSAAAADAADKEPQPAEPHLRWTPAQASDLARVRHYRAGRLAYYAPSKSVVFGGDRGFWHTIRGYNSPSGAISALRAAVLDARKAAAHDYAHIYPDADCAAYERRIGVDTARHWRELADLIALLGDELADFGMPYDHAKSRVMALPRFRGAWDVRAGKPITGDELRELQVLDAETALPYAPDLTLLDKHPEVVAELRRRYGELCLDLCALTALGAGDWINVMLGPPGYGKTLLIDLWEEGFGEGFAARANHRVMKAESERFNPLRNALTQAAAVFVDEIDKPESINVGFVMSTTNRRQQVESKGIDAYMRLRTGQQWWMGNREAGYPDIDLTTEGLERRLPILIDYYGSDAGLLTTETYNWLLGHSQVFVALVLSRATKWGGENVRAIAEWLAEHSDNQIQDWRDNPRRTITAEEIAQAVLLTADDGEYIASAAIDVAIAAAGYPPLPYGARRTAALLAVNPSAQSGKRKVDGVSRSVWYGLRINEDAPPPRTNTPTPLFRRDAAIERARADGNLYDPQGVAGAPTAESPPPPPVIGDCVHCGTNGELTANGGCRNTVQCNARVNLRQRKSGGNYLPTLTHVCADCGNTDGIGLPKGGLRYCIDKAACAARKTT